MQNTLINNDFSKTLNRLRRILPSLAFGLLIGTYLISAIIMGIFHAQTAPNIGFMIAAFLVPLAIQTGRGTLVFFFQLNPAKMQNKFSTGIIAATVLLGLSLLESYFVLLPFGTSWIVSVSTLMLIGYVVEIMILKETVFASQMELYQNPEQWKDLKAFYIAQSEFAEFLKGIKEGKHVALQTQMNVSEQPTEESRAITLLSELNGHLKGNVISPSEDGQES